MAVKSQVASQRLFVGTSSDWRMCLRLLSFYIRMERRAGPLLLSFLYGRIPPLSLSPPHAGRPPCAVVPLEMLIDP